MCSLTCFNMLAVGHRDVTSECVVNFVGVVGHTISILKILVVVVKHAAQVGTCHA